MLLQTLLLTLLSLPTTTPSPLPAAGQASLPTGFRTVLFYDDFSSTPSGTLPSPQKWSVDKGTAYPGGPARWGTNEIQTYTDSTANIAIRNGNLLITPTLVAPGTWTSARIETLPAHDFSCLAGQKLRIESKLRVGAAAPETQLGIWPAFWSLGAKFRGNYNNWPSVGEIDVLETLNGESKAWHTVHCGTASGGPCRETTGIGSTADLSRGDWHVVGMEIDRSAGKAWEDETMTWLVDGRTSYSLSGRDVGDSEAWSSLAHAARFLLLNVAVGGSFPDAIARRPTPDAGTQGGDGAAMEVEYVAVFST